MDPVRTCIGCRSRESTSFLLRIVVRDGAVVPDERHRLPGRGAWLHPDASCFRKAVERKAFGRAFRDPGPLDPGPVAALLQENAVPQDRGPRKNRANRLNGNGPEDAGPAMSGSK